MNKEDLQDLRYAKHVLENPGFAAKITDLLGRPIERGIEMLPTKWSKFIDKAVSNSLKKALDIAVKTIDFKVTSERKFAHKIAVATTGGIGGAFGLTTLAVELPISTGIMLRSIAKIAQANGEDLSDLSVRLSCIEVFAFGSNSKSDDATETGYYAVRAALAKTIADSAKYIAQKGIAEKGAPIITKFLMKISSRFGMVVSQKAVATAVPIVGGIGGATVNVLFIDHFQRIAEGHFIIRRLERKYGEDIVKHEYESIKS